LTAKEPELATGVVSLSEYARLARRRWPSLLIGMMLGLAGGLAWYVLAPPSYEAGATVTINPITSDLFSGSPVNQLVNTETEAEIMRSIEIAERAAVQGRLTGDPRDLRDQLSVTVPQNSLALEISFVADSPEMAATAANAFATSYLDFRHETAEARRAGYAELLRTQLRELSQQVTGAVPGPARQILNEEIIVVRQQLSEAASLPISPGQLVSKALPPRFPASPRRLPAIAGGVVLGLLLGITIAAGRHRRDDRLFSPDEVAAAAGLPVIGILPGFDRGPRLQTREVDDIALAAMRLTSRTFAHDVRSLLVIRADLGRPTRAELIAWWLGRTHDVTLARLGAGRDPHPTADGYVDLSALPPSPGLWMASGSMHTFDGYVLFDGGALQGLADAIDIDDADAVLVAVELGVTRRRALERTVSELHSLMPDQLVPGILVVRRRSWVARSWIAPIRSALLSRRRRRAGRVVRLEDGPAPPRDAERVSASLGTSDRRP
jgi:capsular polysaccharide biosynthesis protein